jgi:outer membrane protein TolC
MPTLVTGGTSFVLFIAASTALAAPAPAQTALASPPSPALVAAAERGAVTRSDTLRLADLVDQALRLNPMLQAARLEADAARERAPQVGALPNPQLTFGLKNRPLNGFGTDQPMTMNAVGLVQRFPWPGVQGFGVERAEYLAEADSLQAREMDVQLVARLSAVYYQAAFLDRSVAIMANTRDLLRAFLEVAETRYAVGSGLQQDVLQAQVEVARMTEDITVARHVRIGLAARINALVGRPSDEPVGVLQLPDSLAPLPAADTLMARAAERRPLLAAAQARVAAADAGYRAARRTLYPDITVMVEYGQRPQYVDFLTLMVGIEVPLWAGKRELPLRRELQASQLREQSRAIDLYNETSARVMELRAEAERARNLAELYRQSIVPQARAAVESALSSYRVGAVDYLTLVTSELTVNRYHIEAVRLRADYHRAVAQLAALVGETSGGTQ